MVTSRREPIIEEQLDTLRTQHTVSMQSKLVDSDIRIHVKHQLEVHPQLKKWSDEIKDNIESTLVSRSGGM
jgi:hypothetical protein